MRIIAKSISEEEVAAIAAAVQMMLGKKKVAVIRVQRSDAWVVSGRHRIH